MTQTTWLDFEGDVDVGKGYDIVVSSKSGNDKVYEDCYVSSVTGPQIFRVSGQPVYIPFEFVKQIKEHEDE